MLFLDLTSKSEVFNCTSPQGHWLYHKFGKRNYPISEIDFIELQNYLITNKHNDIICHSYFGDSLNYSNLIPLADYCNKNNINLMLFTYGTFNDVDIINKLNDLNVKFYLNLTGFKDTNTLIYQNSSWSNIEYIIDTVSSDNLFLEFYVYEHNIKDLREILKIAKNKDCYVKYDYGNTLGNDFCNILDEDGVWLFDIFKYKDTLQYNNIFHKGKDLEKIIKYVDNIDFSESDLFKSTEGYLLLRTFMFERNHKNIFKTKLIKIPSFLPDLEDDVFINFLGYKFNSRKLYETFNNSLCDDWSTYLEEELNTNLVVKLQNTIQNLNESKKVNSDKNNLLSKELIDTQNLLYRYESHQLLSFLSNENLDDYHLSKQF